MNIYVGNLPYSIDRDELKETFAAFGDVATARIVTDRETNRSKGFGFVEMPNDAEARQARTSADARLSSTKRVRVKNARAPAASAANAAAAVSAAANAGNPGTGPISVMCSRPDVSGRLSFFRISSGPLLHSAGSGCILIESFCD